MTSVTLHLDRWGINMALEDIQRMQRVQEVAQSPQTMDDMQMIRGPQGLQGVPPQGARREKSPGIMPHFVPSSPMRGQQSSSLTAPEQYPSQPLASLNTLLKEDIEIHVADLKERGTSPETLDKMDEVEQQVTLKERGEQVDTLQQIGSQALGFNPEDELKLASTGGLIGMAAGGMFEGRVRGDGHGMQDNVFMPIKEEGEQVATLAVSPKEYVVDAHTMSALGNGNADKGADVMDNVVENIREKAYGTDQQPNQINGLAALRPMIERV